MCDKAINQWRISDLYEYYVMEGNLSTYSMKHDDGMSVELMPSQTMLLSAPTKEGVMSKKRLKRTMTPNYRLKNNSD